MVARLEFVNMGHELISLLLGRLVTYRGSASHKRVERLSCSSRWYLGTPKPSHSFQVLDREGTRLTTNHSWVRLVGWEWHPIVIVTSHWESVHWMLARLLKLLLLAHIHVS